MSEREFIFSGCENSPSEFHLKNGKTVYGVVIKYAIGGKSEYHFITNSNLKEFTKFLEVRDIANMERLSVPFNLTDILIAKKLATSEKE